jgi:uncharacterized protein (DUF849 family)
MPKPSNKVIITCDVTGGIHAPTMSAALPVTADEIATQAIESAGAGAAILHLRARDPRNGRPTADPAVFKAFLPRIKDATDAVVNITTRRRSSRLDRRERVNLSRVFGGQGAKQ